MPCDGHRREYWQHAAPLGSRVAQTLGGGDPDRAAVLLEMVYRTSRARARRAADDPSDGGDTTLWASPPDQGKRDPQSKGSVQPSADLRAYSEVQRTLSAAHSGADLPPLATKILGSFRLYSTTQSGVHTTWGHSRCSDCGRWTAPTVPHICPMTVSASKLGRVIAAELGVPSAAYGKRGRAWDSVVATTNHHPRTSASLRHVESGGRITVPLDHLPTAVGLGYVPLDWPIPILRMVGKAGRPVPIRWLPHGYVLWAEPGGDIRKRTAAYYGLALTGGERVDQQGAGLLSHPAPHPPPDSPPAKTRPLGTDLMDDRTHGWMNRSLKVVQSSNQGGWEGQCQICGWLQQPTTDCSGCLGSLQAANEVELQGVLALAETAALHERGAVQARALGILDKALRDQTALAILARLAEEPEDRLSRRTLLQRRLTAGVAHDPAVRIALGNLLLSPAPPPAVENWIHAIDCVASEPPVRAWLQDLVLAMSPSEIKTALTWLLAPEFVQDARVATDQGDPHGL